LCCGSHFIYSQTYLLRLFIAGYVVGLYVLDDSDHQAVIWQGDAIWQLFVFSAVVAPLVAAYLVWDWWRDHWKSHPVARTLALYSNSNAGWISIASDINIEFRR
jgi:hypothetical protein